VGLFAPSIRPSWATDIGLANGESRYVMEWVGKKHNGNGYMLFPSVGTSAFRTAWWKMLVSNSIHSMIRARPRDKSLIEQRTCCVSCSDMVLIGRQ